MHNWTSIVVAGCFIAPALHAQQPTARARADSARADSVARADSAFIARERERIQHEPRAIPRAPEEDTAGALVLARRDAIATALARNPQLLAAREQVNEARAEAVQASAIPEPSFSATAVGQSGPFSPHGAPEHDLALGLVIPFPDRIRLQRHVAQADVETADLAYQQLRQSIAAQTAQTYDSLLVAERHQEDFREARQLALDFLTRTQARYQAGTVARLDVVKAKVDLAQTENQLLAGTRDIANARAGLNRLIGRPLGAPLQASDTLYLPDTLPSIALLEARAAAARPEIRTLQAQRKGASAARSLAREYWLPDIEFSVSRNTVSGEGTTYATGIGIGFPLFFWQHQRGEVAQAEARQQELAAVARDLSAQVSQEVRVAFATANTALQQALYLRDELLPEARQAYDIASTSYRLGGSSALEVLDARRTLLDAASQYTDALGALDDAMAQLELAVGAPLDSVTDHGTSHE